MHLAAANFVWQARPRSVIEVRIEILIVVILHPVVLIAQPVIPREPGRHLPRVLRVEGPVLEPFAARKAPRRGGKVHGAPAGPRPLTAGSITHPESRAPRH